jgi:hypothetical protein
VKKPRICLFTAHPPTGGGGGAILRSLVPELAAEYEISWCYVSAQAAAGYESGWLGAPVIGRSNFVVDIAATTALLAGHKSKAWELLLEKMSSLECDAYWIVSHNEGLCLARDLGLRTNRPIHLTVHDDWAGALCARSQRYFLLAPFAARLSDSVLRSATSVDVVSDGMKSHYFRRTGIKAEVVHRYIGEDKITGRPKESCQVRVGHLGSIYSKSDLRDFLGSLKSYAAVSGAGVKVVFWGANLGSDELTGDLASFVDLRPNTDEHMIIDALQDCDFAYAAYPFSRRLQLFAQTSLPTKLSTYVAARRPILGHAPRESTLSAFLTETGVGRVWDNLNRQSGYDAIRNVLAMRPDANCWDRAAGAFFGKRNVATMARLLREMVCASRD